MWTLEREASNILNARMWMHFVDNKDAILLPLFEGSTSTKYGLKLFLLVKWSSMYYSWAFL